MVDPASSVTAPPRRVQTVDPDGRLPPWVSVVDLFTVLLALAALSVDLFGTYRVRGFISVPSSAIAWIAAFACLAARHYVVRTPPLPRRLWNGWCVVWRSIPFRVFLLTRIPPVFVGYLAVLMIGFPTPVPYRMADSALGNLMVRWDTGWYMGLALEGYDDDPSTEQQNVAFFPAYPVLIRTATALVLSGRVDGFRSLDSVWRFIADPGAYPYVEERARVQRAGLAVGFVLSCVAFVFALGLLLRLARDDLPDDAAAGALVLLGVYPFAIFYGAIYTESVYLLATVATCYCFRHRWFWWAAFCGLCVGLIRPNGFFLTVPLGLAAATAFVPWLDWGRPVFVGDRATSAGGSGGRPTRYVALAVALTPLLGMLSHSAFLFTLTGQPFAWFDAQSAWGRDATGLVSIATEHGSYLLEHGPLGYIVGRPYDVLNLLPTVLAGALIWPVTRRFGIFYGSFLVVNLLPPLLSGGLESMGRYTSVLFPLFLYLAAVSPNTHRAAIAGGFGAMQGLVAALFFTWRDIF